MGKEGNVKKISIYYDDQVSSCNNYMKHFEKYEGVIGKKASEYVKQSLIFESENIVGFVYSSMENIVSDEIAHIMARIVMSKESKCFLIVTGGKSELRALKYGIKELEDRGYWVVRCLSPYLLEKKQMDVESGIKDIIKCIDKEELNVRITEIQNIYKEKVRKSKPMRKKLRKEAKEYFHYRRKKKVENEL